MVYAISDLHLATKENKPMDIFGGMWENYIEQIVEDWRKVKGNDIVLIAGDISWAMKLENALGDLEFIGSLGGHKVILKGNHDYWWSSYSRVRDALPKGVYAVQNDSLKIGGYIICGSRGWAPLASESTPEDIKIFEREKGRLKLSLDDAMYRRKEEERLLVMMHFPPFTARFEDSDFTEIIAQYPVSAVVYGHLHGRDIRVAPVIYKKGIPYYLTSCDLTGNRLVTIESIENRE